MSSHKHLFDPPTTAQELDALMRHIDKGDGDLASLSDEQREQLKNDLAAAWLEDYLDDYPVPAERTPAALEYRAIAGGEKYPNLPEHVRSDLLIEFDEIHGEGGPEHWNIPK
ncbi:MAG: hypothetical protein ABWY05_05720 [Noviherbaspirillum sp.]